MTNIVVLLPFVYLQGELRVFYVPLAVVVVFSQAASLLVGFTPHIVTLVVLAVASQRLRPPAADGQPYRRGQQS